MIDSVIDQFRNDIISYINNRLLNDAKIPNNKKPQGKLAFTNKLIQESTKSFFVVNLLNDSPESETFNDITTLQVNLQIDIFAYAGKFNNKEFLPQNMATLLKDEISGYMRELKFGDTNENIILMREVTSSPSMPYEDGDRAYFSSIRYQFTIMRDYVSLT